MTAEDEEEAEVIRWRQERLIRAREVAVGKWREERALRLKEDERGALGLSGLFWLEQGVNTFGSDPSNKCVLPPSVPGKAGWFLVNGNQVTISVAPGVEITCNGSRLPIRPLRNDTEQEPDYLELGRLIMVILLRGKSLLVRVWDRDNPARVEFKGLNWYPYKPDYRVTAIYSEYSPSRVVNREDIIGITHESKVLGTVAFELDGNQVTLEAEEGGGGLFFSFSDKTNGLTTYPGGRYLVSEELEGDHVVLDFNKAYNMPCAYVVYATCNLPLLANRLGIPIEAGEMKYKVEN